VYGSVFAASGLALDCLVVSSVPVVPALAVSDAHSDMADLEAKLIEASELQKQPKSNGEQPLILIVTDGVFSMDGGCDDGTSLYRWPNDSVGRGACVGVCVCLFA
jgi:hypothetical protein